MCGVSHLLVLYGLTNTDWLEIPDLCSPQLHDPQKKVLPQNCKCMGFISTCTNLLSLLDPNKFWPGFTFSGPNLYKLYWAHFVQPHGINICIGFVSLDLLDQNMFWPGFTFPQPNFSKIYWGSFCWSLQHQHSYRICFPWPSGHKHILTWVYFPSA